MTLENNSPSSLRYSQVWSVDQQHPHHLGAGGPQAAQLEITTFSWIQMIHLQIKV